MHPYRTHTCGELRSHHKGEKIRISGWINRKRDHGNLLFIDLRDFYGQTQCVVNATNEVFDTLTHVRQESVVTITGKVVCRTEDTINTKITTGEIEIQVDGLKVESLCNELPLQVVGEISYPEETRLKYRYLDIRREKVKNNILLRSRIISYLRRGMEEQGFIDVQTPILTASSPEGARDFVVPSRRFPGMFYALPQAPQQFKQLLMVSGIDKYYQIAPSFRDEDARSDRSPGEFYQLDYELAYCTQDDVFQAIEPVLFNLFKEFSDNDCAITQYPFPQIPYSESLGKYGSDKPDLRNPLFMVDVTSCFEGSGFGIFSSMIKGKNAIVKAIRVPNVASQPRKFFDGLTSWAQSEGLGGLAYIIFKDGEAKGPVAKHLSEETLESLKVQTSCKSDDGLFFICAPKKKAEEYGRQARAKLCEELDLLEDKAFRFCWVVDFPMYEKDEKTREIIFSHNPFSMPQGGLNALNTMNPLEIKAYQYDIVCNGVELSSGAIRNHLPEVMVKAFEIAGYSEKDVKERFSALYNAFQFGAPPHGGCAPGIDRIVMLLANEPNIREVIPFPMDQQARDLMMGAPCPIDPVRFEELHIQLKRSESKSTVKLASNSDLNKDLHHLD